MTAPEPSAGRATSRAHAMWLTVLSALYIGDVVDVAVLSYAAPAIRDDWGLSIEDVGVLTSLSFLGMFVGAIVGGRLSDVVGRKRTIIGATFLAGASSLVSAIAPDLITLAIARVFTGMGLQAVTGVLIVYVTEMFPSHSRGKYQAIMLGAGTLGIPLSAWVARLVVPLDESSWRWLFVLGTIGILPALAAMLLLPESTRWQHSHTAPPNQEHPSRPEWRLVLHGANRRRVIVTSLIMIFGILAYYGFHSWVPTLLVAKGQTKAEALEITSIYAFAPLLGCLTALLIVERWERKRLSLVLTLLIAACMAVFAYATTASLTLIAGFLVNLLLQINTTVIYTYLPEVFPTGVRGLGAGIANGFGRLAGFANGFLIAAIFTSVGFTGVFLTTAVCMIVAGLIIATFGEQTRGRQISAHEPETATPANNPSNAR